ncbi:MAG: hypothetical protein ACQET3_10390, partial [Promethearchaeati archaeon]
SAAADHPHYGVGETTDADILAQHRTRRICPSSSSLSSKPLLQSMLMLSFARSTGMFVERAARVSGQ